MVDICLIYVAQYQVAPGICKNQNDKDHDIVLAIRLTLAECKDKCDNTTGCNAVSYCHSNKCSQGTCYGTSKAYITPIENWKCHYKTGYMLFKFNIEKTNSNFL